MKVKTYQNQSLQEGLEDIKRDLGSDALILSTRSVSVRPKFGLFKKQTWEITAALEEERAPKPVTTKTPEPSLMPAGAFGEAPARQRAALRDEAPARQRAASR